MSTLTTKLHTFHYLDGAAGFRHGRTYPLRYEVLDDNRVSIELDHVTDSDGQPRRDLEPLVLDEATFRAWFVPVGYKL